MDIEQLKLVMDTLAQMGAQGKEAFIWWLIFDKALVPLVCLLIAPMVVWGLIKFLGTTGHEQKLRTIRDAMGIGTYGWFMEHEFREIMQRINRYEKGETE